MARWLVASADGLAASQGFVAMLSMVIVISVCVTMLVALCAAHGSPQILNRDSEPEGESPESKKHSQRFSNNFQVKLSSFRKSSFRRIDCKQVDVIDAFQKGYQVTEEENNGAAVWQRAILRGERCAPLAFSGLILYDEKGNPLPLRNSAQVYSNSQHTTDTS